MANCEHQSENHSRDRVAVYYGNERPMILCGFHASRFENVIPDLIRTEVLG